MTSFFDSAGSLVAYLPIDGTVTVNMQTLQGYANVRDLLMVISSYPLPRQGALANRLSCLRSELLILASEPASQHPQKVCMEALPSGSWPSRIILTNDQSFLNYLPKKADEK